MNWTWPARKEKTETLSLTHSSGQDIKDAALRALAWNCVSVNAFPRNRHLGLNLKEIVA